MNKAEGRNSANHEPAVLGRAPNDPESLAGFPGLDAQRLQQQARLGEVLTSGQRYVDAVKLLLSGRRPGPKLPNRDRTLDQVKSTQFTTSIHMRSAGFELSLQMEAPSMRCADGVRTEVEYAR